MMLKTIPPLIGPDLLHVLACMGHGDEIAIVDANYPAESAGPDLVRMDGHSATDVLDAVLSLLPLDTFVDVAAHGMAVVGEPETRTPVMDEFEAIIGRHQQGVKYALIERFAFYERVRGAFAVVQTGERRLYGNIVLTKGVIGPEG
jgi:L-fucose mutarotase